MNIKKKRIIQKLWGWVCLSINCLIITLFLGEKVIGYPLVGILLSLSFLCSGAAKTLSDKNKNDLSGGSVAIEYVCIYIITFLAAFKITEYLESAALLLLLIIVSLGELTVFVFVTYWNIIRNILHRKSERL